MKTNRHAPAASDGSSGASELIGGILMITIVVGAVALIAVVLFSQPVPQKVPNVNFMTGTDAAGTELFLYHNGGDTLHRGEFAVVIDNGAPRTDYTLSDGSYEWSLGKNLILGITGPPQMVSLVYYGGNGGTVLLRSASSGVSSLQKSINPSGTPVPSGGGPEDAMCSSKNQSPCLITALLENVSANRIVFYKNSLAAEPLPRNTYLSLKVTDTEKKSMIVYVKGGASTLVTLNNTDIVMVTINPSTRNFKTFGIAPQIWELTVDQADLTIVRSPPVPTITVSGASIAHTWINRYDPTQVTSTLVVQTTGTSVTSLTVNNTRYLPLNGASEDSNDIAVYSPRPLPVGLFLLTIDSSQHAAFLVGTADQICIGARCGPYGL